MSASTAAEAAFRKILEALGATPGPTLSEQLSAHAALKSKLGRKPIAERLGLSESDLSHFESALGDLQRWLASPADAPRRTDFIELAALGALQWLDALSARLHLPPPPFTATSALSDTDAAAQVRALELVLRELVHESYRTQDSLTLRLQQLFRPDTVAKWQRSASGGDVLTGLTFGELASLVVSRDEYPRYQPLLEVQHFLAMMRERRKTLRSYLDGLRLVRNALAHHKPLTPVQRALVERYAREIFAPLSLSWSEGRTQVNPDVHLGASQDGLAEWVQGLADDVREVQDDVAALKDAMALAQRDVSALEGGLVLVLLAGLFFLFTIGVGMWTALSAPPGVPDLAAAAESAGRGLRGLGVAALTFLLAVVRVGLNLVVFKGGGAPGLRAMLTGRRALVPLAAWAALGLAFFYAPVHVDSVERPILEAQAVLSFTTLDEGGVDTYLAGGGDPNAVLYGSSLLHLTIMGTATVDGGTADDQARRARVVQRLLDAGAHATEKDRNFAVTMGHKELLPLLQ